MSDSPVVIYSAASLQQAYLLRGLLEEEGIAARVVNEALQIAGGELPLGWTSAARVVVAAADAPRARQLAEEFDQRTAHEPLDDAETSDLAPEEWTEWPACPRCGERRSARCTVCGASGSRFPVADMDVEDAARVLLICEACDDHFHPDWYRLCPRCGHDYGEGFQPDPPPEPLDAGLRSWTVVALLLAGALALAGYFVWLFRG